MIYIAAPLFTADNLDVIKRIEELLDDREEDYFSPREYGVIKGEPMTSYRMKRIFDMNIRMLRSCKKLIAVTDDYDPGTIFELGIAFMLDRPIITYSPAHYGANVMLKYATLYHCRDFDELDQALNGHGSNDIEVSE